MVALVLPLLPAKYERLAQLVAVLFCIVCTVSYASIGFAQDWPVHSSPDKREFLRRYAKQYRQLQNTYRNFNLSASYWSKKHEHDEYEFVRQESIGRRGKSLIWEIREEKGHFAYVVNPTFSFSANTQTLDGDPYDLVGYSPNITKSMEDVRVECYVASAPYQFIELDSLEFLSRDNVELLNVSELNVDGNNVVQVDFANHVESHGRKGTIYGYIRFLRDYQWAVSEWYFAGAKRQLEAGLVTHVTYDLTAKQPVLKAVTTYNHHSDGSKTDFFQYDVESFAFEAPPKSVFTPAHYGIDLGGESSWMLAIPSWIILLLISVLLLATALYLRHIVLYKNEG